MAATKQKGRLYDIKLGVLTKPNGTFSYVFTDEWSDVRGPDWNSFKRAILGSGIAIGYYRNRAIRIRPYRHAVDPGADFRKTPGYSSKPLPEEKNRELREEMEKQGIRIVG